MYNVNTPDLLNFLAKYVPFFLKTLRPTLLTGRRESHWISISANRRLCQDSGERDS
jgi:hypothetical protein